MGMTFPLCSVLLMCKICSVTIDWWVGGLGFLASQMAFYWFCRFKKLKHVYRIGIAVLVLIGFGCLQLVYQFLKIY